MLGVSRSLTISLLLMTVTGFGMMQQMAASNTILQTIAADDKRGRVMSFYTLAILGMNPIGSLLAGSVAARIGVPATMIGAGRDLPGGGRVVLLEASRDSPRDPADLPGARNPAELGRNSAGDLGILEGPLPISRTAQHRQPRVFHEAWICCGEAAKIENAALVRVHDTRMLTVGAPSYRVGARSRAGRGQAAWTLAFRNAQRLRCASAIRLRVATLNLRLLFGATSKADAAPAFNIDLGGLPRRLPVRSDTRRSIVRIASPMRSRSTLNSARIL